MTDRLTNALSDCLDALEAGTDVETCLMRYPDLASDLRPLLVTSLQARSAAVAEVPPQVVRRARARVLNAAAEMREQSAAPAPRLRWPKIQLSMQLTRLAVVTLVILAFMVTGGTGLVSASSGALPGDQLYPLKRGWEDLRLLLAIDPASRETLEKTYEEERAREIGQLFSTGSEREVDFYGSITARAQTGWVINQVVVQVVPQTRIDGALAVGAYVEVEGRTDASGVVIAERIRLRKPAEGDETSSGSDGDSGLSSSATAVPSGGSASSGKLETPETERTGAPESIRTPEVTRFEFEGIVQSISGSLWRISGQNIDVSGAELRGSMTVGSLVRVRGEISAGVWRATRIELRAAGGATSASGSASGGGESSGSDSPSSASSSDSATSSDDSDHGGGGSSSSKSDDD